MFILSPNTLWNPGVLEARAVPKRVLGRVSLHPRRGAGIGLRARMIFENELFRYLFSLAPVVAAALIWRDKALAISQAPLLMFAALYLLETRVLRVPKSRRAAFLPKADLDRGLDLLRVRALSILTRIAAGRGMAQGQLHLVIDQSDLLGVSPLTLVSVQGDPGDGTRPGILNLTADEEAMIRADLFQPPLDERQMRRITVAEDEGFRSVVLEVKAVSAHARLAAMMR